MGKNKATDQSAEQPKALSSSEMTAIKTYMDKNHAVYACIPAFVSVAELFHLFELAFEPLGKQNVLFFDDNLCYNEYQLTHYPDRVNEVAEVTIYRNMYNTLGGIPKLQVPAPYNEQYIVAVNQPYADVLTEISTNLKGTRPFTLPELYKGAEEQRVYGDDYPTLLKGLRSRFNQVPTFMVYGYLLAVTSWRFRQRPNGGLYDRWTLTINQPLTDSRVAGDDLDSERLYSVAYKMEEIEGVTYMARMTSVYNKVYQEGATNRATLFDFIPVNLEKSLYGGDDAYYIQGKVDELAMTHLKENFDTELHDIADIINNTVPGSYSLPKSKETAYNEVYTDLDTISDMYWVLAGLTD